MIKITYVPTRYPENNIKAFQVSRRFPCAPSHELSPTPPHYSHFHHQLRLPVFYLSINGVVHYVIFCVLFVSLNKISAKFFQSNLKWTVALYRSMFFLSAIQYSIVQRNCIYLSSDYMNKSSRNILLCIFFGHMHQFSG